MANEEHFLLGDPAPALAAIEAVADSLAENARLREAVDDARRFATTVEAQNAAARTLCDDELEYVTRCEEEPCDCFAHQVARALGGGDL